MAITKKGLREALKPLRQEAERQGLAWMDGKKPVRSFIEYEGLRIGFTLIRRGRVICNVPAPYFAMEIHYSVWCEGRKVFERPNGGEFVDALPRWLASHPAEVA